MRGPKIVVFHIRQLLRTGAFVLAGLIIILLLVWALAPKDKSGNSPVKSASGETGFLSDPSGGADGGLSLYIPGTYSSNIVLDSNALFVTVTVDKNRITGISLSNFQEAQELLYPLFRPVMETLSRDIIQYQTTDVSVPEEGLQTGKILLDAINLALSRAYADVVTTGF